MHTGTLFEYSDGYSCSMSKPFPSTAWHITVHHPTNLTHSQSAVGPSVCVRVVEIRPRGEINSDCYVYSSCITGKWWEPASPFSSAGVSSDHLEFIAKPLNPSAPPPLFFLFIFAPFFFPSFSSSSSSHNDFPPALAGCSWEEKGWTGGWKDVT